MVGIIVMHEPDADTAATIPTAYASAGGQLRLRSSAATIACTLAYYSASRFFGAICAFIAELALLNYFKLK